jgi:hypothetical protein
MAELKLLILHVFRSYFLEKGGKIHIHRDFAIPTPSDETELK